MAMITEIFRASKKEGAYLYLAKGKNQQELPEALRARLGRLELALSLVLTPDKKLAQADASKVLASIDAQGYYLQLPPPAEAYMQGIANSKLTDKPI